jgi:transposase-like protein
MSQNETQTTALPDPEVRPKAKHRQFTAEYKKRILDEADSCTTPTQRGALVRREGLYSSHLTAWRRQRAHGILDGLAPKKRGVKPDPFALENAQLRREIEQLQEQLHRAETIIDVQKKVSQLLGRPTAPAPRNGST